MRDMLIDPELDTYIQTLSEGFHPVLAKMEKYAYEQDFPIIGPQTGRLLYQLTRLKQPESIFELGSGFGYSSLWFALACPAGCLIHHTDTDAGYSSMAKSYLDEAGVGEKLVYHVDDALNVLRTTPADTGYDIIFCDIDKTEYPEAFALSKRYLAPKGMFIADNILWHGLVADRNTTDPSAIAVRNAASVFLDDPSFVSSILSVRDGVLVSIRL